MISRYKLSDLLLPEVESDIISLSGSYLYSLFDTLNNKYYVGTAKNLYTRFYLLPFSYVECIKKRESNDYVVNKILEIGPENFQLLLEVNSDDYEYILSLEPEFIKKYDSFYNGYNLTKNGLGGTSGMIVVNNGVITKAIHPNRIQEFYDLGFLEGSLISYIKRGSISIINDLNECKFIDPCELNKYKLLGWRKGSLMKGRVSIHKGDHYIRVTPDRLPEYELQGYVRGQAPRHWKEENYGRKFYSNPVTGEMILIKDSEVEKYAQEGFTMKGKITLKGHTSSAKGTVHMYDPTTFKGKRVKKEDIKDYLEKGYLIGNGSNQKLKSLKLHKI